MNLGSDAAECWVSPSKNIKPNSTDFHVSSPRQTEYKVFCSKLDGLPMPSNGHINTRSRTPSNNDLTQEIDDTILPINTKSNEDLNVSLMRVASLPTVVNAPSLGTGKCRFCSARKFPCNLLYQSISYYSFHTVNQLLNCCKPFSRRRCSIDSTSRIGTANRRRRRTRQ